MNPNRFLGVVFRLTRSLTREKRKARRTRGDNLDKFPSYLAGLVSRQPCADVLKQMAKGIPEKFGDADNQCELRPPVLKD